jgi:hypothetical protein
MPSEPSDSQSGSQPVDPTQVGTAFGNPLSSQTPSESELLDAPFLRASTIGQYSKNSFAVERLPEILWKYLQHKYSKFDIGPLQIPKETVLTGQGRELPPDVKDAVERLEETLPGLTDLLRKAGIRRVMFDPEKIGSSVKSGRYSFVIPQGSGATVDVKDSRIKKIQSGQLVRISSPDEEQEWEAGNAPPMLLKPLQVLQDRPVNVAVYPEIITKGITRRHVAFLDMVSTMSGYFFDDFLSFNAGLIAVPNPTRIFTHKFGNGESLEVKIQLQRQEDPKAKTRHVVVSTIAKNENGREISLEDSSLQIKTLNAQVYNIARIYEGNVSVDETKARIRHNASDEAKKAQDTKNRLDITTGDDVVVQTLTSMTTRLGETGFQLSNRTPEVQLLPVVLDGGAISDHANELTVLKEFIRKRNQQKVFADCNFKHFMNRRENAETGDFINYPKVPPVEGYGVKYWPYEDRVRLTIDPRTLPDDFKQWFEKLGLPPQQIDDFNINEQKEYAFELDRNGHLKFLDESDPDKDPSHKDISEMVHKHFGQMAIVAQVINAKIHELYAERQNFPEDWPSSKDRQELEAYKALRKELTKEIRKVIAPLYERAQDNYAKLLDMTPGQIGGAVKKDKLDARNEVVAEHESGKISKIVHKVLPFSFLDFRKKSRVAQWLEKHPDVDPEAVGLAMQKVIEEEMVHGRQPRKNGDPKWMQHRDPGDSGWMDKVEAELAKMQQEGSNRKI